MGIVLVDSYSSGAFQSFPHCETPCYTLYTTSDDIPEGVHLGLPRQQTAVNTLNTPVTEVLP